MSLFPYRHHDSSKRGPPEVGHRHHIDASAERRPSVWIRGASAGASSTTWHSNGSTVSLPSQVSYRRPSLGGKLLSALAGTSDFRLRSNSLASTVASDGCEDAPTEAIKVEEALLIPEFVSRQMVASASSMINEAANNLEQLHAMLRARQDALNAETNVGSGGGDGDGDGDDAENPIKPEMYASGLGATTLEELDKLRGAVQHLHHAFATSGFLKARAAPAPAPAPAPPAQSAPTKTPSRRPSLFRLFGGGGGGGDDDGGGASAKAPSAPTLTTSTTTMTSGASQPAREVGAGQGAVDRPYHGPFAPQQPLRRESTPPHVQASGQQPWHSRQGSSDSTASSDCASSLGLGRTHWRNNSDDSTNCSSVEGHSVAAPTDSCTASYTSRWTAAAGGAGGTSMPFGGAPCAEPGRTTTTVPPAAFEAPAAGAHPAGTASTVRFAHDPFGTGQQAVDTGLSPTVAMSGASRRPSFGTTAPTSVDLTARRPSMTTTGAKRRPSLWKIDESERIRWENDTERSWHVAPLSFRKASLNVVGSGSDVGDSVAAPPLNRGRLASLPYVKPVYRNGDDDNDEGGERDEDAAAQAQAVLGTARWQSRKSSLPGGSLMNRMATAGRDKPTPAIKKPMAPIAKQAAKPQMADARGAGTNSTPFDNNSNSDEHTSLDSDDNVALSKRLPVPPHLAPAPASRRGSTTAGRGRGNRGGNRGGNPPMRNGTWGRRCSVIPDEDEEAMQSQQRAQQHNVHLHPHPHPHIAQAQGQLHYIPTPASGRSFPETASSTHSDFADMDVETARMIDELNVSGVDSMPIVLSESASACASAFASGKMAMQAGGGGNDGYAQAQQQHRDAEGGTVSRADQWNRLVRASISRGSNEPASLPPPTGECQIPPVAPAGGARRRPSVIVGGQVHDVEVRTPIDALGYQMSGGASGNGSASANAWNNSAPFYHSSNRKYGVGRRPSDINGTGTSMGVAQAATAARLGPVTSTNAKATLLQRKPSLPALAES